MSEEMVEARRDSQVSDLRVRQLNISIFNVEAEP